MKGLQEYRDFICGDACDYGDWAKDFQAFMALANTIRQRLGIHGYLLDTYLEYLLRTVNGVTAFFAVSEGQESGVRLRELCRDIIDREREIEERPFYEKALAFIEMHPLRAQERHTKVALYFTMLSPDFLTGEVARFLAESERLMREHLDVVEVRQIYDVLCEILEDSAALEELTALFQKTFMEVAPMDGFLQGFVNELLGELIYRDRESSKEVFQLLLDGRE